MPDFDTMLGRLNAQFAPPRISELSSDSFDGSQTLSQIAQTLEIAITDDEVAIIDGIPDGMQAAVRAFIQSNLSADPRPQITFAAIPGYDYELTIALGYPGPKGNAVVLKAPYVR